MPEPLTVSLDTDRRLLVEPYENGAGRGLVTVIPQYRDKQGLWRLAHSGLMLTPDAARQLAPALVAVAAALDGAPVDPMPTDEDRELSRMP